jgi:hypothetical protein
MCCSFVITLVLEYFQQSYPIPTYESRIEWCAALLWLHVLGIFQQSYPIPPIKQGLSDVLLFCDYMLSIFQQSYPIPPMKQGLSDVLLFCDYVLKYFSTVLPTYEAGIKVMCCSFVITCVRVFFNSPTQFHLWSRD